MKKLWLTVLMGAVSLMGAEQKVDGEKVFEKIKAD